MNIENEIKAAIENSIKSGEVVRVEVSNVQVARDAVSLIADDCDGAQQDGSLDVWGTLGGGEFRLRIVVA